LRLSEGPEDLLGAELSLTRRLLTLFVAFVLFSGTSLFATAAFDLDQGLIGKALAANARQATTATGTTPVPVVAATAMATRPTRTTASRAATPRSPTTTATATATRARTRATSA